MCGIGGYYGFKDDNLIKKMSHLMEHRGPDGEGIFKHEFVTLLSRRLAIIDVKGGDQPIYNEDKSIVVVYNGEMYNYRELRKELEQAGHVFKTKSDTEIIVHGYEEWGDDCFDRFNGMFGIALYDIKKDRLLVVRDHFGIKPIYYAFDKDDNNSILFSSEIKPILDSGRVVKEPNERIIYRYLKFRIHDEGEETFFAGIKRLLPGQVMVINKDGVQIKSFTNLRKRLSDMKVKDTFTDEDRERFKAKLIQSIQRRLVAEVPVGTCLSGGLDSSTVVAVANKLLKEHAKDTDSLGSKQKAYSAVFPGSVNDEEKYVDALITKLSNVDSIKVKPKPEEFFEDLEDFVKFQEEPTISTGPYAQYQVMRRAHKDVTVVLDGQGADEMMAGYLPYYFVYMKQLWREGNVLKLLRELLSSTDIFYKLFIQKMRTVVGINKTVPLTALLKDSFATMHHKEKFVTTGDNLKARLLEDIFGNSLQALLRYEDKNAMRFSIEGRVPFLDFELVELLFQLPDEAIIKDGWNKAILRYAVDEYLPEMITKRRNKIGFTTPEHEWFLRMKNRIYGIFMSESFANREFFNQAAVVKAFEEFIQGKNDDTMLFWRILNIEIWMRIFFDEPLEKEEIKEKGLFEPNKDKNIEIKTEELVMKRYPIKTDLFAKGDNFSEKISGEIKKYLNEFKKDSTRKAELNKKWFVIVSEKIVAISQGRSYFIWDIKPGFWAKTLSKSVKRTPYGIGLGSPWTMQIAIQEVGLPRILFASVASVFAKLFGISGTFYRIAGRTVASIDGPTEYSLYPSNVSAKLGPKDPINAAKKIKKSIEDQLSKDELSTFGGVVIIDANDLGRDILGNATDESDEFFQNIMKDNPMGQGSEQTPIVLATTS